MGEGQKSKIPKIPVGFGGRISFVSHEKKDKNNKKGARPNMVHRTRAIALIMVH